MTTPAPHLAVDDLVAGYVPDVPILRGMTLTVATGEIVTVLGPNGAGKSTLVKAVAGVLLGVVGFFGVGAYTAAYVTGPNDPDAFGGFGLHPLVGYLAAMVVSGAVAFVVGLPTIRLKHDFLAIGTFGIAICIQLVAMNWKSATRGFDGLHSLPKPFAAAAGSPFAANLAYLAMVVAIILLVTLALERMVRSPWGRMLLLRPQGLFPERRNVSPEARLKP